MSTSPDSSLSRRSFLAKAAGAGALALTAATMGLPGAETKPPAKDAVKKKSSDEDSESPDLLPMAKGLTLATIVTAEGPSLGIKTPRGVLDVVAMAKRLRLEVPPTIDDLIAAGDDGSLKTVLEAALKLDPKQPKNASVFLDPEKMDFGPVVTNPGKIICLGLNYKKHAEETGNPVPKSPIYFGKYNNTLNAHRGTIKLPAAVATQFDYEVELVIVLGREASNVSEADALGYVFGYCTGNDFSARDLQTRTSQWLLGKTCDGFAPLGPWLVTADQVPDPNALKIECRVNGETRQSSNTKDLIFNCQTVISYASKHFTLQAGDVIFTGTPEGVIHGMAKDKQVWLKAGDKIACSVGDLGELQFALT